MKTQDIELMISVLKGNIAGLEMMNTNSYVDLQNNADEFQGIAANSLLAVIDELNAIVDCLNSVATNRNNSQDIMSAVNDAIGLPGFNF